MNNCPYLKHDEPAVTSHTHHTFRPLVYICSPYAGDIETNVENAKKYSRFAVEKGCIPITPHLLYPQILDDTNSDERELGLFFGCVLMDKCKEIWVFGDNISSGMNAEIVRAKKKNYPLRYFTHDLIETTKTPANEIHAIQTEYKGYLFRSRLEARWAVFFDACGIEWEYEPEGYDLGDGVLYLPDFLLHDVHGRAGGDLYVEVKGIMSTADGEKIKRFSEAGRKDRRHKSDTAVLVVGVIPPGNMDEILGYISTKAYQRNSGLPNEFNFETIDGDFFAAVPGINKKGKFEVFGDEASYIANIDFAATEKAYRIARQARFEYGETPEINGGMK